MCRAPSGSSGPISLVYCQVALGRGSSHGQARRVQLLHSEQQSQGQLVPLGQELHHLVQGGSRSSLGSDQSGSPVSM